MKLSLIAASLCVLGSASAFVFPASVRSGAMRLHESSSTIEEADKTKAREALIDSSGMDDLLKMIGSGAGDEAEAEEPQAKPATKATKSAPPAEGK